MTVIELRNLTHTYPDGDTTRVVLDSVNFQLTEGELVAVMGRSGSGKSTLLNAAAGIITPDSGDVIIDGRSLTKVSTRARAQLRRTTYGIVYQRNSLVESLTAQENVALPLELGGQKPRVAMAIAGLALEAHNLQAVAHKYPHQISGGQRQQVAVAAALSADRKIILADEPTGALDSTAGDDVMRLIRQYVDSGRSGIVVTHDARDAAWADRIIYIADGVITSDTGSYTTGANFTSHGDRS